MFARTLFWFPILVVAAFAQDRVPVAEGVSTYGHELKGAAMVLELSAKVDETAATISVTGGQSHMPLLLVASFEEARVDLSPIAIDGWLLVGTPALAATVAFDMSGSYDVTCDITNKELVGKSIHLQAVALAKGDTNYEIHLSRGLTFEFTAK